MPAGTASPLGRPVAGTAFGLLGRDMRHGGVRPMFRAPAQTGVAVTVRDAVTPAPLRFARAVARASMVRDVAAFFALVVLATMLSVASGLERLV